MKIAERALRPPITQIRYIKNYYKNNNNIQCTPD